MISRPKEFIYVVIRINAIYNIRRKLGIYETLSGAKKRIDNDKLKTDPESDVYWFIYVFEYQKVIHIS